MSIKTLQQEQKQWAEYNFPKKPNWNMMLGTGALLGIIEEVGELAHAHLKEAQGIRGDQTKHQAAAKDALGDIFIYMLDYMSSRGWDAERIIEETWMEVKKRDWRKNPTDAAEIASKSSGFLEV